MFFLCVDDSATLRKILTMTLKGAGHQCAEAENGQKALEFLSGNTVDCIILDVNMPVMGGVDFLRERANRPAIAKVPVIVLTTESDQELIGTVRDLGANGFLGKPFQKDDLLMAISQVTGR
jgi:two-component system chemotaxis response regulator CheY